MLSMMSALVAALAGAGLIWRYKPKANNDWPGSDAAYFIVAVAVASFGFMQLITLQQSSLSQSQSTLVLMLEQLSLYAAIPLLACIELAKLAKRQWSRQIWGRILLAIAATFELCRRNDVLNEMLWVSLAIGTLALLLTARSKSKGLGWIQALLWGALLANALTHAIPLPATLLAAFTLCAALDDRFAKESR